MILNIEMRNGDGFMFKKLILIGALSIGLSGCNNPEPPMISEVHEITNIEGNEVYGENINGKGEGIFYTIKELKDKGIKTIAVGDKIKFSWKEIDFRDENWDGFHAEKVE